MSDKAAGQTGVPLTEVGNARRREVGRWRKDNEFGFGYIEYRIFFKYSWGFVKKTFGCTYLRPEP